jgi:hypothetical protein
MNPPEGISRRASSILLSSCRDERIMEPDQRKRPRVKFERGFAAQMMAIDGTWRRECMMEDVSDTGAKLTIDGTVEGLGLKEFFLVLSSTGLAYRRCQLVWINGDQIGVAFLKPSTRKEARGTPR